TTLFRSNPPRTITEAIQRINQVLESAGTQVSFQNKVLQINLGYGFTKAEQFNLGFNLDDRLNAGLLKEFVDVNASAPISLAVGGTATVGLVIDLTNPTSPVFAIKDTSGLNLTTLVNAASVNVEAAVGPLGLF